MIRSGALVGGRWNEQPKPVSSPTILRRETDFQETRIPAAAGPCSHVAILILLVELPGPSADISATSASPMLASLAIASIITPSGGVADWAASIGAKGR